MLERLGAAKIVAIEGNARAYLKCLVVKELLHLQRARFLCGDFMAYLRERPERFDVCFASGVLYHMTEPVDLIRLIAGVADRAFLWTHYYDAGILRDDRRFSGPYAAGTRSEQAGFAYTRHLQTYQAALGWSGFCGGPEATSVWLERDDILRCLAHFGFGDVRVNFDNPAHPNGPSFALVARRS